MKNPTERFTDTVCDYIKYRPSYPHEVLDILIKECDLTPEKTIADMGSGTGFLAKLFLDYGCSVYGVEPNEDMREAGEDYLQTYPNFYSVNGSAEKTTLRAESIDIITAGTAFHWFDIAKTKIEFKRILRSPGWACIVWNVRDAEVSPLVRDYENLLLKYCKEYKNKPAEKFNKTMVADFFAPFEMQTDSFRNAQYFDFDGLKGRLLSSSFSLRPKDENYDEMLQELKTIFNHHQQDNKVEFLYSTKMYYGRLC